MKRHRNSPSVLIMLPLTFLNIADGFLSFGGPISFQDSLNKKLMQSNRLSSLKVIGHVYFNFCKTYKLLTVINVHCIIRFFSFHLDLIHCSSWFPFVSEYLLLYLSPKILYFFVCIPSISIITSIKHF